MLHTLLALIAFISIILIIVGIHELGHFIAAKLCKIKVLRFSLGFGKPLYRFQSKHGTEYVIAAIPLGGYVKLSDDAFNQSPLYQRFFVMIAGSLSNLIFSFLAFWLVLSIGITYVKPIVGAVVPGSLAQQAGLKKGEEIIAIDNRPTAHWAAIAMALISHYGEAGTRTVSTRLVKENQPQIHQVNIDLRQWKLNALRPDPLGSLGIVPSTHHVLQQLRYPPLNAWRPAWEQLTTFVAFNLTVVYKMVTGVISWQSLGGPLTIFKSAILAAGQGVIVYINFLGLLGASIALINLLPIPGLDGAQIVYILIEAIRRRPLSAAVQVLLFRLGIIVLSLVMIQALLNDLLRLT